MQRSHTPLRQATGKPKPACCPASTMLWSARQGKAPLPLTVMVKVWVMGEGMDIGEFDSLDATPSAGWRQRSLSIAFLLAANANKQRNDTTHAEGPNQGARTGPVCHVAKREQDAADDKGQRDAINGALR